MSNRYVVSSCERYCIFQYKSGLFGVLIKKCDKITTITRQFHTSESAIACAERSINEEDKQRVLESENIEQMSLF